MKTIIMTTESPTPVNMSAAGVFNTGEPREVEDELAELLLKREFPKFVEAPSAAPADNAAPAKVKKGDDNAK